jgi:hypothetical protein
MKIIGFVIVMLVAAPVFGAEPLSDEKQILKLEDDWVQALVSHDRDVLDQIVAPSFTFIEPDGTHVTSATASVRLGFCDRLQGMSRANSQHVTNGFASNDVTDPPMISSEGSPAATT